MFFDFGMFGVERSLLLRVGSYQSSNVVGTAEVSVCGTIFFSALLYCQKVDIGPFYKTLDSAGTEHSKIFNVNRVFFLRVYLQYLLMPTTVW